MAKFKSRVNKVMKLSAEFVQAHEGDWNHSDWENFLADVSALGVPINDALCVALGQILEACKKYYRLEKETAAMEAQPKRKKKKVAAETEGEQVVSG
jgi:hypothetical protein